MKKKRRATARVAPTSRQRMRIHVDSLRVYWRGLQLLVDSAPLPAAAFLALLILFSSVPVMQIWLMKWLIDLLSAPLHLAGRYTGMLDGRLLIVLAVLYLLTLLLPGSLQPLQDGLAATIKERAVAEVDRRIIRAAAHRGSVLP